MALGFATLAAQSQTFTGTVEERRLLGGNVVVASDGPAGFVSGIGSSPLSQSVFGSSFQGDAGSGFSRVNAMNSGEDMASVADPASVVTHLLFTQWVTNPTSTAQNVSFSFYIPSSSLTVSLAGFSFDSLDALASFAGVITWGGVDVWDVNLALGANGTFLGGTAFTSTLTQSASASGFLATTHLPANVAPGGAITDKAYVNTQPYFGLLSLGTLNPGETRQLNYSLDASAYYYYSGRTGSGIDSYGGVGGSVQGGGRDPFGFELDPVNNGITFSPVTTGNGVPEPGVMALAGIAAFGVWATRGRRRGEAGEKVPVPAAEETPPDSA